MALTARAPSARSASAAAHNVAPVVTTSSTSTIQRPSMALAIPGRTWNASATFSARCRRSRRYWARRGATLAGRAPRASASRPRPPRRSAPPGRSRARDAARRGPGSGRGCRRRRPRVASVRRSPRPADAQAGAHPRTSARGAPCGACPERRTPLELEERAGGPSPSPSGVPAGSARRASMARRHVGQIGGPSAPQPGHDAGSARSSSRPTGASRGVAMGSSVAAVTYRGSSRVSATARVALGHLSVR